MCLKYYYIELYTINESTEHKRGFVVERNILLNLNTNRMNTKNEWQIGTFILQINIHTHDLSNNPPIRWCRDKWTILQYPNARVIKYNPRKDVHWRNSYECIKSKQAEFRDSDVCFRISRCLREPTSGCILVFLQM